MLEVGSVRNRQVKHILIIELSANGHHSAYLEHIASAYLDLGCRVTITLHHHCERYSVIARLQRRYTDELQLRIITDRDLKSICRAYGGNLGSDLANWFLFRKKFLDINSETKIDSVFIPYVDYCMNAIGVFGSPFGSVPWGGICMQASIHHFRYEFLSSTTKLDLIKRIFFFRLLRNRSLTTLFTIDELLFKFVRERDGGLGKRIQYLADPAELKGNHTCASAREVLDIPKEATVILVYGVINSRKGLDYLVKAFDYSDIPKSMQILIVGKQDGSMDHLFQSKEVVKLIEAGRVLIINEFVDDAMQQMVFAAADIVWLGYENHFAMSGVLVLAAIAGRVVLSTTDGLIGWHTRKKKLGVSVDVQDIIALRKALIALSDKSIRLNYQRGIDPIFSGHTWDNAVNSILSASVFVQKSDT